jgi:hypothetical protein
MKTIAPNPAAETPEFMQRTDKQFVHKFLFSFLNATIMWTSYKQLFLTYHKPQVLI